MGYCILFPWLCGLRSMEIAEQKQIILHITSRLESQLETVSDVAKRMELIDSARADAVEMLKAKGHSPYTVKGEGSL